MPRIDFTNIDEAQGFEPLPAGQYRVVISDVEEKATKSGDEMWNLSLTVLDGEHRDRLLYDRIVFSDRARPRVKLVCSRLGLDVSKAVDLAPAMLLDRTALVTVEVHEYQDAKGDTKSGNRVTYNGWERDPGPQKQEDPAELPF
jgi:hypothetical protein